MVAFLEDLLQRRETAIEELCHDRQEETLHLEFKTLADHKSGQLTREDRRLIGKAICGFANAEGGLLILGIASQRIDNLDCALAPKPIAKITSFRNRLQSWLPDALSSQHLGIVLHIVLSAASEEEGYVVIEVPPSDRRPHMSIADQGYHRRGSQGTAVMLHGEVRDLMLAPQTARLEAIISARESVSSLEYTDVSVAISLRNTGRVPARSPYVLSRGVFHFSLSGFDPERFRERRNADGWLGVYADGLIVHVEDMIEMGHMPRLRFHWKNRSPGEAIEDHSRKALAAGDLEAFSVGIRKGGSSPAGLFWR